MKCLLTGWHSAYHFPYIILLSLHKQPRASELASPHFLMSKLLQVTWYINIRALDTSHPLHASPPFSSTSSFLQKSLESGNCGDAKCLEVVTFGHLSDVTHLWMSKGNYQADAFHVFSPSLTMHLLLPYLWILLFICIVCSQEHWGGLSAILRDATEAQGLRFCIPLSKTENRHIHLSLS